MNGTPRLHPPPPRECGLEHCDASGSRRAPRTARRRGSPPVPSCCALPALSHPLAVVCNARSHLAAAARPPAPPRPFGYARLPCGGPLLSFLRSSLFSAPCTPAPCSRPRPVPPLPNNCRWRPPMQAALSRLRWMVCSRVSLSASLSLSLNTYCPGSILSFFSQCSLGCTHDTIQLHDVTWHSPCNARLQHAIRYNCMMSPGILLLQRAASSGIILRQSESITCQLHPTT